MNQEQPSSVSVVVATRNRAPLLRKLLSALEQQEHQPSQVIVVDDSSDDCTEEVLDPWQGKGHIALRLDHPSGSYAARNLGWKNSGADVVAFTDDDCLPEPEWLSELLKNLQSHDVVAVQGAVRTDRSKVSPFTHQIEQLSAGPPYRTCNMAYKRWAFERIGGFDESLKWYGDNILGWQVQQFGTIAFAPNAVVLHPPRNREWRSRRDWLERFHADTKHRRELYRLKAERFVLPAKALPLALWILRPLIKQSSFHAKYFLSHPWLYARGMAPLLSEKWQMLLALVDFWKGVELVSAIEQQPATLCLPPLGRDAKVSTIVVTKHRASRLASTLEALGAQTWKNHEVVVVDHGPDADTKAAAVAHEASYLVATGTLAAARQAGINASSGEIVAFTDDDCLPEPQWAEALALSLQPGGSLLGVQGRTVAEKGPIGSRSVGVSKPNALYRTCNIAYRRQVLEEVGGFDLEFDGWFEDTALGARVVARGDIGFEPRARVLHSSLPRVPLSSANWTRLLKDEAALSSRYPSFYRKTRGPGFLVTVVCRWVVGSTLKTLVSDAPKAARNPHGYFRLIRLLIRERAELVKALRLQYSGVPVQYEKCHDE